MLTGIEGGVFVGPSLGLPLVVVVVGAIVGLLVWDILRGPVRGLPKWVWIVVVVVFFPLGGLVYLLWGRNRKVVRAGNGQGPRSSEGPRPPAEG